jgi:hypothetical protein
VKHRIEYKFALGDVLSYQKEVTLLLQEPDGKQFKGIMTEEMIQEVIEDHGGWWTVALKMKTLTSSGSLCADIPEELIHRSTIMQMDLRGSLLDTGQGGPQPPRVPAFPLEEVGAGQSWLATAQGPDDSEPLEIQFFLERFEENEDETVAHLVTLAKSENPKEDYVSETQGTVAFSVTHGHQVSSTSVVKLTWGNGRVSHTVIELKLTSRTP